MKTRPFGSTETIVSELCLGTSTFARYAGQEETFALLDAFRAAGGRFVQTSGICPGVDLGDGLLGLPEQFLGRWLLARAVPRSEIVIATRMGAARPLLGGASACGNLVRDCVTDSLGRIGIEHLDFLVLEGADASESWTETVEAFAAVVRAGYVRHLVLAPSGAEQIAPMTEAQLRLIGGLQLDYSLTYRAPFERAVTTLAGQRRLGFMARSPLAGGHLVSRAPPPLGSFHWRSADDPAVARAAEAVWPALRRAADQHGASTAQVALAWVLAQPAVTSALISVRSLPQLRELLAAAAMALTREDCERLTAIVVPDHPGPAPSAPTPV